MEKIDLTKIKCVIIDFDGTMYSDANWDTCDDLSFEYLTKNNIYTKSRQEFLAENNFPKTYHFTQCIYSYLRKRGLDTAGYTKWENDNIYNFLCAKIRKINPKLVENLCYRYPVFLLSDSSKNYILHYLDNFNLNKYWFAGLISNDFTSYDLSKFPFMADVVRNGNYRPDEVIMIGDSYYHDIVPAKKLGIQTAHVKDVVDTEFIVRNLLSVSN